MMTVKELMEILKNYKENEEIELVTWESGGFGCAELLINGDVIMTDED